MRIIFTTNKLQKQCSFEEEIVLAFGSICAKKLQHSLFELDAAPTMDQIPQRLRCHPLTGNLKGVYAIDLAHPFRLLFKPYSDDELLRREDGSVDLSKVSAIEIVDIRDYH
ncbi:MAG: hypothetical protein WCY84_00940 [Candidatus Cloacimonadaceae bacterium]